MEDPREREAILELARGARQAGWWTRYDDVCTGRFPGFEAAARRICTYEAVLQRLGTGGMMREQVQHLLNVAESPAMSVTIQILPVSAGLHAGLGGAFVILDFDEVNPIVYLETDTDGLYLEKPGEIARYRTLFQHVEAAALRPKESLAHLKRLVAA